MLYFSESMFSGEPVEMDGDHGFRAREEDGHLYEDAGDLHGLSSGDKVRHVSLLQ